MTDQDKNSNAPSAGGSSVVMMDKKSSSRRKPFPADLHDETPVELHHKRSRAPAVPSVSEELKESTGNVETTSEKPKLASKVSSKQASSPESLAMVPIEVLPVPIAVKEELKESTANVELSSEKPKLASKVSSKRASSPESIAMVPIEVDVQRADVSPSATQPIPVPVGPETSDLTAIKDIEHEDSITDEITELRIEEGHREWSEEEAGGLPRSRSESRASRVSRTSRVSRMVRELMCCGVRYNHPSEHDISSPRTGDFHTAI